MILRFTSLKAIPIFRLGIILLLSAFILTSSGIEEAVQAQAVLDLPAPGTMVSTSVNFNPLQLKGILVDIKNPLRFNFLVDKGDSALYGPTIKR